MKTSAIGYYLNSIYSLLRNVRNPVAILQLVFEGPNSNGTEMRLKTGETFFISNLLDLWVVKETLIDRQYEAASLPLEEDWTVVDIGAAMGDYAVWAARQVPHGRVVAVEPFPEAVELMRHNLGQNSVSNVEVIAAAVTGKSGPATLNLVGGSLVQHSTAIHAGMDSKRLVSSLTLQELLTEAQVDSCDYLKMDCEGAEYDILFTTAPETMAKIQRICMEVHDGMTQYEREDMQRFLQGRGYLTKLTLNPVHENLALLYAWRAGEVT